MHRLVATLFVPNPNNYTEVNHKDYNRANPRYDKLEWVTHKQNIKHSSEKGRYIDCKIGLKNGRSKYTKEEVYKIRNLYDEGKSIMEIIKIMYPSLNFKERRSIWNGIKSIATRKSYNNI